MRSRIKITASCYLDGRLVTSFDCMRVPHIKNDKTYVMFGGVLREVDESNMTIRSDTVTINSTSLADVVKNFL